MCLDLKLEKRKMVIRTCSVLFDEMMTDFKSSALVAYKWHAALMNWSLKALLLNTENVLTIDTQGESKSFYWFEKSLKKSILHHSFGFQYVL